MIASGFKQRYIDRILRLIPRFSERLDDHVGVAKIRQRGGGGQSPIAASRRRRRSFAVDGFCSCAAISLMPARCVRRSHVQRNVHSRERADVGDAFAICPAR